MSSAGALWWRGLALALPLALATSVAAEKEGKSIKVEKGFVVVRHDIDLTEITKAEDQMASNIERVAKLNFPQNLLPLKLALVQDATLRLARQKRRLQQVYTLRPAPRRRERAALSFLGNVLEDLVGTPSEDTFQDTLHLLAAVNEEASSNARSIDLLANITKGLDDRLVLAETSTSLLRSKISTLTNYVEQSLNQTEALAYVLQCSLALALDLDRIEAATDAVADAWMAATLGLAAKELFPDKELMAAAAAATAKSKQYHLTLPTTSPTKLFGIATSVTTIVTGKLRQQIKIPLIDGTDTLEPTALGSHGHTLYLSDTGLYGQYLHDSDLQHCKHVDGGAICFLRPIKVWRDEGACLNAALCQGIQGPAAVVHTCHADVCFHLPTPCNATLSCDGVSLTKWIPKEARVSIPPNCELRAHRFLVEALPKPYQLAATEEIPLRISELPPPPEAHLAVRWDNITAEQGRIAAGHRNTTRHLEHLHSRVRANEERARQTEEKIEEHTSYHYGQLVTVGVVGLGVVLIVGFLVITVCCK